MTGSTVKTAGKNWFRLDTAALIFPATAKRDWCNVFRLSASLKEDIDPEMLQRALDDMRGRFPSFFVALRRGFFWCCLEKSRRKLTVRPDFAYPLAFMSRRELKNNCVRVLYYKNRIAAEFFHSVTDGRGGSVFLCNLAARYIELKYGVKIPRGGILRELKEEPTAEELEDSFLKYSADVAAKRSTERSYRLHGTREKNGFKRLITGVTDTDALLSAARERGVSVTAFLAAVMAESIIGMQEKEKPLKKRRPVKITVPVDLRRLYGSSTLRNFALVLDPGVDPRWGEYGTDELCRTIYHQIRAGATKQNMAGMIAANVLPQRSTAIRLAPLFVKNAVMKSIYRRSGESGGSINVSNLSKVDLPSEMLSYVDRMEFILGPQRSYPNNCSVLSCGGKTYINMISVIRETELERRFFSRLVELGVPVEIESNSK